MWTQYVGVYLDSRFKSYLLMFSCYCYLKCKNLQNYGVQYIYSIRFFYHSLSFNINSRIKIPLSVK